VRSLAEAKSELHTLKMASIDLENIIESSGISKNEIAAQLFPTNSHAYQALHRVIKGKTFLNSEQLSKLALIIGCSVGDLFAFGKWSMVAKNTDELVMSKGDVSAVLDFESWITRVYHNGTLHHELHIHSPHISLTQYLAMLDGAVNAQ
jgi:hypothetical protein